MLDAIKGKRILVVGDVMLDVYTHGVSARISPEAPVPVIHRKSVTRALGGAANVAANVKSLGGDPFLIGHWGPDESGKVVSDLLRKYEIDCYRLSEEYRPTTTKNRIFANQQQLCRFDREETRPMEFVTDEIAAMGIVGQFDAVILSDYDKGVITPELINSDCLRGCDIPVIADPKRRNIDFYEGIHTVKPNESEILGYNPSASFEECLVALWESLQPQVLLVTLGDKGMLLCTDESNHRELAYFVEVADATGSGDIVTAAYALGIAANQSPVDSMIFANKAAAIGVSHHGCHVVTPGEIIAFDRAETIKNIKG